MPKGKFVPEGRKGRTMVLVDIRETLSVKASDIFLQIRPGKDFEAITALRAIVKGQRFNAELVEETGLKVEQLQDLADRMKRCKFGVIFFPLGMPNQRINMESNFKSCFDAFFRSLKSFFKASSSMLFALNNVRSVDGPTDSHIRSWA